jgi:hypothetical protein
MSDEETRQSLKGLENLEKWYQDWEDRAWGARVWMLGKSGVYPDVHREGAAKMYRKNFDGCRDLWKLNYRQGKSDVPAGILNADRS